MADPEIAKKNGDTVADEILRKIPAYTPEWTPAGDDAGLALIKVYADLADIAKRRLNMAPKRQFLAFLESLNITLHPAQPARVPLTFLLSEGTPEPVLVPASSLASAQGSDGKPVMFQTEENLLATPSKIIAVYSVTGDKNRIDEIYNHSTVVGGAEAKSLFSSDNLQEHALYLGDSNLFNIKGEATIYLTIFGDNLLQPDDYVDWFYLREVEEQINGEKKKKIEEYNFSAVSIYPNDGKTISLSIQLTLGDGQKIEEIEIPQIIPKIKSRWIKCKVKSGSIQNIKDIRITDIIVSPNDNPIIPDFTFYNDVPLDVRNCEKNPIYPFGQKPQINNTWYIACEKAFSKKGAKVDITIQYYHGTHSSTGTSNTPVLSWEYWDGEGWQNLDISVYLTSGYGTPFNYYIYPFTFCEDSIVTMPVGDDSSLWKNLVKIKVASFPTLKKITVNGKMSYWIRVRLIGGDYGNEFTLQEDPTQREKTDYRYKIIGPSFHPPTINKIIISYGDPARGIPPDHIIIRNNLRTDLCLSEGFQPFLALPDDHPALYFGFDTELPRGETSLFVALDETNEYPDSYRPKISWQYLAEDKKWKEAIFLDETHGFTRSGMVKLFIAERMSGKELFGEKTDRFWVRAVNTGDEFCTIPPGQAQKTAGAPGQDSSECRLPFELMNTSLVREAYRSTLPTVTGIYLNSVWASQSTAISDEIAGSGSGEQSQTFPLLYTPVTGETVWVDELTALTESERKALEAEKIIDKKTDDKGNLLGFWVRWKAVDDLVDSKPSDRHYTIDRTFGVIAFGDGKNGRIPPIGRNNIRISYSTGGGIAGNVPASGITKLHSAIAFVDKVKNTRPSLGGTDTESTDTLIIRAPPSLKNRGRAVTSEDYELLALGSSPEVARAKALQNVRLPGPEEDPPAAGYTEETGYVTVVIVPKSSEAKPVPSPALIGRVQNYLEQRCPNVVTLAVIRPSYVSASVTAELFTTNMDAVPVIEKDAKQKIAAFLHPLSGNTDGKGWALGSAPCLSDLYSVLEDIADVEYVKNVTMKLTGDNDAQVIEVTDASGVILLPIYALVYPGECRITATPANRGEGQ